MFGNIVLNLTAVADSYVGADDYILANVAMLTDARPLNFAVNSLTGYSRVNGNRCFFNSLWIPAFAGMTEMGRFSKVSDARS